MNRRDFQQLSRMRIREARMLLDGGLFCGSYYLAGYSVECALKAVIARRIRRYEFPDKALANQIHTHNLRQLILAADLAEQFNLAVSGGTQLEANWKNVLAWQEGARYILYTSERDARTLFGACADRSSGVLRWLRNFW